MAAGDIDLVKGTTVTWRNTAGDEDITLTSLATSTGRVGTPADLGTSPFALEFLQVKIKTKLDGIATAVHQPVEVYLYGSDDGTDWTLGDEAVTDHDLSSIDKLVNATRLGSVQTDETVAATVMVKYFDVVWSLEHVGPVIYNGTSQALSSTAADHEIDITPYYRRQEQA